MANKIDKEERDILAVMEKVMAEQKEKENVSTPESISFLKVAMKCEEKIEGDITEASFKRWLDKNVIVQSYLPLRYKKMILDTFYIGINDDKDFSDLTYMFEIFSVLNLLMFYTNIELQVGEILEENYDLVVESGLFDYIKSKCEKDYELTRQMGLNGMSFMTFEIIRSMADVNLDETMNAMAQTEKAISGLDLNGLQLMKEIIAFNDPSLTKVRDIIYDGTKKIIEDTSEEG